MKALAHPLRLKVIVALSDQEMSVQDLVEAVGTTQSNVSQHLTIMRDKEILSSRRVANQVLYRVGDCKVLDLVALTRKLFCPSYKQQEQANRQLGSLEQLAMADLHQAMMALGQSEDQPEEMVE
ncbi:MAG: winged helix-turn-helix transcriptional regulator [Magnetococcales bacterium]|nr:winged helix-turn-helix transcriptional regulator [Magnetococcales bacterium]